MKPVLQTKIPYDVTKPRPMPGISPLEIADLLLVDEAFGGQMAIRDTLLSTQRRDVLQMDETAEAAAQELLGVVLDNLAKFHSTGFDFIGDRVTRPDGVVVAIDYDDPMGTLGRLVQDDFCILEKRGDEHVLTAAVLCFPASWALSEKFLQPLTFIHGPVAEYDADIAKRVQRLFDGIRMDRPLWRFNALWYSDAALFQPRRSDAKREAPDATEAAFLRSERQCLMRLPMAKAVVFSIHTYVVDAKDAA